MLITVTGATGNVGSTLLRTLADARHDVVGVSRRPPETAAGPYDGARWVAADLAEESSATELDDALRGADAVVHLAWGFQPSHRTDYLEALGVGGTGRVLAAAARAGVRHVVHMSSVGAYSPRHDLDPVDETWPTGGIPSSVYSRHKSAAERLLDRFEAEQPGTTVTRLRPGIIANRRAGSALLRYGVPALVPRRLLRLLPVLPLDRSVAIPVVHADDVAGAIDLVLGARLPGAVNLAAEPAVRPGDLAEALGARHVHVPYPVVRAAAAGSWHARLQQVDPGWVDLAHQVPLLDTARARTQLGWAPRIDALGALHEVIDGILSGDHDVTPPLRPRSPADGVKRLLRRGPVALRRRP
ncbi:NAD-dependent epimerase/dehydratase family protein [Nocardioides sp. TF02-7]|uniref:NAD-dependent epimerase/dehydratase family protein n=1 Tax=Nocardioides sp. TF02-7 TaxID=2917724 RepID=UPI001F050720|nr:NAD-dependent epimerase/dehydratase family protein [Nocardioides sp. TF02-7]UMG91081.1 NAD-dependent epimerase/dehydratase family protein [Nocardioides sp. TF02-7]